MIRLPHFFVFCLCLSLPTKCWAAPRVITVDADPQKSAEFASIQSALASIPEDNVERVVIEIADGLYYEKLRINQDRVTLRGESRTGVQIQYHMPRSEYDRRYDKIGPAVVNVFGNDIILENLTIDNIQPSRHHAFALYGQPNRMILNNCDVLSNGGDTVSLWNTPFGMYYHKNCRFTGGVDFVCPRGWCYVEDCQLECPTTSAAIWHDGHLDLDMKFVLRNCKFTGIENFWIGRNHYPSQFYLLDCQFGENMADKPILKVKEPKLGEDPMIYDRKYFHNCHRTGGDYEWHKDNLETAAGAPSPNQITPAWTFDGKWDPVNSEAPKVVGVETSGDEVHVYFSEKVAGAEGSSLLREDNTSTVYQSGNGTNRIIYSGGTTLSKPSALRFDSENAIYGTVATLQTRYVTSQNLPPAKPRQKFHVVLVGDSTVATYDSDSASQGWGTAFPKFFDDRLQVTNLARGGRSSKSFRDEGHWDKVASLKPDYVLIQFGHNDNPGKGPERETDPAPGGDYRANLRRYVEETRAMGAKPVLISPPARRKYDEEGRIRMDVGNIPYAEAVLAVAQEMQCPAIDLNSSTRDLFNNLGEEHSNWIQPVGDRTHFTPAGAYRIAALVAEELQTQVLKFKLLVDPDALIIRKRK